MTENYYDDEKNVRSYIEMAAGYDGAELIEKLREYVPAGAEVLEIGMGPGTDLTLLNEHFKTVGSDRSTHFLDLYRADHPDADLLLLDATTLETDRTFAGIYSNKVLHHLAEAELGRSLARQADLLEPDGIALHSFWRSQTGATYVENQYGPHFVYYTVDRLIELATPYFDILEASVYAEMEDDDSICLILRRT